MHRNNFYLLKPESEHGKYTHERCQHWSTLYTDMCEMYTYVSLQINIYPQGRLLMRLGCREDIQLLQTAFMF